MSAPVEIGEMLAGKYRVDRVLGQGGMGIVVAATHVQLDQRVAIKFLLPDALANPDVVARFQREARAAVKIQSEHVARVIDVGTLESGAPYMVMEYLEGGDLAQRIQGGGALPVSEAVKYILEACEALAEAHNAGIVHRDLKPANLFLAKRADKTSIVKVLDFGISKSAVGAGAAITSTQAVMGSPYYMSPEQLMSAKHTDARSDIWSLGIVLYEALVGAPPYVGDTIAEIVAKILQSPVPSVRAHRPDAPPEVDRIVATCLAKDASNRYRDVAALARDLALLVPDGARSVDRISRVLGSSVPPPANLTGTTLPLSSVSTPLPDQRGGTVAMQRSGVASTSQPQAAWGATQVGVPKQSNTPIVIALVGVAILLGGLGIFVATRKTNASPPPTGIVDTDHPTAIATEPASKVDPPVATTAAVAVVPPPSQTPAKPAVTATSHVGATTHVVKNVTSATVAATAPPPPPPATTQQPRSGLDMGIK